jgi:hypothetical protein
MHPANDLNTFALLIPSLTRGNGERVRAVGGAIYNRFGIL